MKSFLMVAVASLLVSAISPGQDVIPSISGGSKAVLFDFSGLADLSAGTYEGGIGARYYLSSDMAVRGGLQFTSASVTYPTNVTGVPSQDGSRSATQFGILGALEVHMTRGRVSPYLGAGAGVTLTSTEYKQPMVGPGTQPVVKNNAGGETINGKTYYGSTALGIYGLVGVEFFLYKELSLGAEYRVGLTSLSPKDEEDVTGTGTTTTKGNSYSEVSIMNTGTITLAVYF